MELSKFVKFESVEMQRSEISLADYNPRLITDEARKAIKRGIKKFGLVGGIVVNKHTGNRLVSGHQRISVMDELQKYNEETKENDYILRVDMIDVEEKQEKELLLLLNNTEAQGYWDYDRLRELIPDIDYKDAGFTEADLSMIGVDFMFDTEEHNEMANELDDLMSGVRDQREEEKAQRKEQREKEKEAERLAEQQALVAQEDMIMEHEAPKTYDEKAQHMKEVKAQVKDKAIQDTSNLEAYLMLSFDNWENKVAFCEKFGFNPNQKFIKGEYLDARSEPILDEE